MNYLYLFFVICFVHSVWTKDTKVNKTFVPTSEWQEIPEGQGIPAGLHIRLNLETGMKEAKILEDNDSAEDRQQNSKNAALSVIAESSIEEESQINTKKHKRIKHLDEALQRIGIDYTPKEKIENIIREYQSYEGLLKNFEGTRRTFKTDAEIIVQLIEEFRTSIATVDNKNAASRMKTQIQILESFNYLLSQYDNALVFVDKGGVDQVLLPIIVNTTQSALKVEAMRVLGAMSQNNLRVQVKVFERNVGTHLTKVIMTSSNTDELSAALYAFGSLLRKFPLAQQNILSTSGTQALISVLNRDCELKIKIKAIVLISDLLETGPEFSENIFSNWLMAYNYCERMAAFIKNDAHSFLEAPDYLEYVIYSLTNQSELCLESWSKDATLKDIFYMLRKSFVQSENEYHLEVRQLLDQFLSKAYGDDYERHDEL